MLNKIKWMLYVFILVCVMFCFMVYIMYKNVNLDCDELGNKYIFGM